MTDRIFPLPHLKKEGAPAHPEDVMTRCGCAKCEENWQRQLAAYEAFEAEFEAQVARKKRAPLTS